MARNIDEKKLEALVLKLLDKAGKHPRLTPRLLREKAEQKLSLNSGDLKFKRELIKNTILAWWDVNVDNVTKAPAPSKEPIHVAQSSDTSDATRKALTKLAKAAGKGVQFFSIFSNMPKEVAIVEIRKKLREEGLTFSDIPTDAEINKISKTTELRKEKDAIDMSLIIDKKRKREVVQNKVEYNSSDEEADF